MTRLGLHKLPKKRLRLGRPPTSLAKTTNLALPCSPENSRRARSSRRPPSSPAHHTCGVPSRLNRETRVVSTTTCAPWNCSRPSATTLRRRASTLFIGNKSKTLRWSCSSFTTHANCCALQPESSTSNTLPQRSLLCGGQRHQRDGRTCRSERRQKHAKTTLDNGPPCDLTLACSEGEKSWSDTALKLKTV